MKSLESLCKIKQENKGLSLIARAGERVIEGGRVWDCRVEGRRRGVEKLLVADSPLLPKQNIGRSEEGIRVQSSR